jgi:hypothetical protein
MPRADPPKIAASWSIARTITATITRSAATGSRTTSGCRTLSHTPAKPATRRDHHPQSNIPRPENSLIEKGPVRQDGETGGGCNIKAELLAGGPDQKVRISRSSCPVPPLIESESVCCRNTYVTCLANAKRRANGVDEIPIYAVIADPGRQIRRRYCAAGKELWGKRLILRPGWLHENQKRQTRDEA